MTTKYEKILECMREAKNLDLMSTFARAIEEETTALLRVRGNSRASTVMDEAATFYAEDVFEMAIEPSIDPDTILNHRRKPTAWAIGRKLYAASPSFRRAVEEGV